MVSQRQKIRARKCPICGRKPDEAFKPFCSKRCTDADLARWLGSGYVIPGKGTSDEDMGEATREKPKH